MEKPARPEVPRQDAVMRVESPPAHRHLGRTILVWIIVIGCVLGIAAYAWTIRGGFSAAPTSGRAGAAGRPVHVVAERARLGDLPIYLLGEGTVTPLNIVTVRTQVNGLIMKFFFKEGQLVHKGDPLADIDPRPFQVQIEQAQGQLAKDQAALLSAESNVAMDKSASSGAVSQQQLVTDEAAAAQDQAATKIDQAMIDSANLQLTYSHIISPIDGRVGLQLVNIGNFVQTSDAGGLTVITQLQPISVEFSLPEDDIPQIMGSSAVVPQLTVDAYDRSDSTKLSTGKLDAIDSQIDPTTGNLKWKALFDNKDYALYPGQFVNAHVLVDTKKNVVIVPAAAVQQGPDSTFVYVVKRASTTQPSEEQKKSATESATTSGEKPRPTQTVQIRNITPGPTYGDEASILKGLSAGEVVVTDGVDKLQDGSKVTVSDASGAATRPSAGPTTRPTHHHQDQ